MGAQLSWESICLTSRGSQVRALLFPPMARQFSWLERQPVTLEVVGSSPIQVAILPLQLSWQSRGLKIPVSLVRFRSEAPNADLAHLVERHLAKVEVASSSLVIRSNGRLKDNFLSVLFLKRIWHHSQVVRQRSAKPLRPGSNPGGASRKRKTSRKTCLFFFNEIRLRRVKQLRCEIR